MRHLKNTVFSKWFIFLSIIVIAAFLRFYQLSNVPPSASLDEASIGYNAYSILITGADEYKTKFPILLRAYDDWRPALYVYLVIPFVKLLGLNVFSVRLPSVILSILTVLSTYFLVKNLFNFLKYKIQLALFASFLLAISPWHIYISRLGHEANAGLAFVVFAITFFICAINQKNKKWLLILSSFFFALSFYTYQSEKIFVPLLLICLFVIFRKNLLNMKKEFLLSILIGVLIITPMVLATAKPEALIRFKGTSAFSQNNKLYQQSAEKILQYKKEGNILGQIIYNRRIVLVRIFLDNYLSHFNIKFAFFGGVNESFKAPGVGLLYLWELPFFILGFAYLISTKGQSQVKWLISFWFLIAFIPAAITTGAPHAMRSYNVLPSLQILTSLGIVSIAEFIKRKKIGKYLPFVFYGLLFLVISSSLGYFYKQYFYVFPKTQSGSFQYALSQAIPFVMERKDSYTRLVFSNTDNLYQSYMFFLFYSKYDPKLYQKQGGTISGGFAETHRFGKYEFGPINLANIKKDKSVLYVGNFSDFPKDITPAASFADLNGIKKIEIVVE